MHGKVLLNSYNPVYVGIEVQESIKSLSCNDMYNQPWSVPITFYYLRLGTICGCGSQPYHDCSIRV